jgi:hypothetical protein
MEAKIQELLEQAEKNQSENEVARTQRASQEKADGDA